MKGKYSCVNNGFAWPIDVYFSLKQNRKYIKMSSKTKYLFGILSNKQTTYQQIRYLNLIYIVLSYFPTYSALTEMQQTHTATKTRINKFHFPRMGLKKRKENSFRSSLLSDSESGMASPKYIRSRANKIFHRKSTAGGSTK